MAASNVAVPVALATAGDRPLEPSVWGDFFVTYTPPTSPLGSKEHMRKRVNHLKGEVRRMFEVSKTSAADAVKLVGTVERLGVEHYFREEIDAALSRIRDEELVFGSSDDLHIVALRFYVFDKFRDDGTGAFSVNLCSSPRALLSLYNAAHMATPEETALDEAIAFARRHLEAMKSELRSPLAELVSRALGIPLPRIGRRLETMYYVAEYEQDEGHDAALLELARLVRLLHLKELSELCLWWRDIYDDCKLSYARDRMVEMYFWACGVVHEDEKSRSRIIFVKTFALISLTDDTYDVHATLEDCQKFTKAIQRWHESAASTVPEYLRTLYLRTLRRFKECEDMLEPNEKYRMCYVIEAYKKIIEFYLKEATLAHQNYKPSFKEHVDMTSVSSGLPMLVPVLLMGLGHVATKEAFEWALSLPDMVLASGEVGRFLNDLASYTVGKNKKDVASTLECYMEEYGATGEEAFAAVTRMNELAWRRINRACMELDPALLRAAQSAVVDLTRSMEFIYLGGKKDAYTFGSNLKDHVTSLFLKPVSTV
ncbi:unnamed protein product [Urochloa decumbens]|uniref:Uncharacterized protein n=1 Tax=Urochloa decumbens TaxID=240449 RepID=A0ABC8YBB3_9POAL